ncbi:MAG: hypothetical protein DMG01_25755 [Acidobacteria bacterium]|nr:MAG: hypothetical protein DMG01_25755 [Acidobacteriota bacterium]
MRDFIRRIRQLIHWRRFDDDLAEEMAFHRDMAAREREEQGIDPNAAVRAAHRTFGSGALAADQARDVWIPVGLRDLSADVRFAFRLMWRERAFTATAVSTLALAIGMSNTVYTVVNAMILRGLPVAHPDRIVMFNDGSPNSQVLNVSYRDVEDWRAATASFAEIGLFSNTMFTIGDEGRSPDVVGGSYVSTSIFRLVEERPMLGRDFLPADEQAGAAPVVILGYSVWTSRYGSDPSIVGKTMRVNNTRATIIGVMPRGFRFPLVDDLWLPVSAMSGLQRDKRDVRQFRAGGRLVEGISMSHAQAELAALTERLAREYPATNRNFRAAVLPYTGTATHPMFLALFGAVSCVLLVACANVSNLLLARSGRRPAAPDRKRAVGFHCRRVGIHPVGRRGEGVCLFGSRHQLRLLVQRALDDGPSRVRVRVRRLRRERVPVRTGPSDSPLPPRRARCDQAGRAHDRRALARVGRRPARRGNRLRADAARRCGPHDAKLSRDLPIRPHGRRIAGHDRVAASAAREGDDGG